MATDIERLMVRLEANATAFEKNLARAQKQADRDTRAIEKRFDTTNTSVARSLDEMRSNVARGLGSASGLLGGLAAGVVTKEIIGLADTWQQSTNKIKAAGLGDLDAKIAMDAIAGIADRARTDFASTADLYARLTRAGQGFGATQAEVAVATEVVAKSLKLTGASAQETESTLVQLGQALTSGRLQGDELRSLSENAPIVAKAIADAFGVSIGKLKDLGAEGKLTSDKVFRAIVDAQPGIDKAFATTTGTVADGYKRIETAALKFVGTSSTTNGAIAGLAAVLNGVASNFDTVATGAAALGAVLVSRLAAAGLAPVVAAFGATIASGTAANAVLGAAGITAARSVGPFAAAALAARGLGAALYTIAGGPVGLLIFGLITILGVFAGKAGEGATASKTYADALAKVEAQASKTKPAIEGVTQAVDRKAQAMRDAAASAHQNSLATYESEARNLETTLRGVIANIEQFGAAGVSNGAKEQALASLKTALEGDSTAAIEARVKIEEMGAVNPSFSAVFGKLGQLLTALAAVRQSAVATGDAMARLAVQQAADREKQRAASDQSALFKAGMMPVGATEALDPAFKRLELQRTIALSKIDDTKKRIDAKAKELYDKDRALGQALSLSEYAKAAGAIIANEDAAGGGKGKKGGAEKDDPLDKLMDGHRRRVEALQRETSALGETAFATAKAEEAQRLLDGAKDAGITVTDALRARIDQMSAAYATTKTRLDEVKASQQAVKDLQQFIGTSLSGFFSDVVSGGKNASDALMNMTKKLADAAFQAALLGQGPLGQLFGMGAMGGGIGGLLGMLFGGFGGGMGLHAGGLNSTGLLYASTGGRVVGPGSGTSDSIPTMLSNGEFVVNSAATKRHAALLHAINSGTLKGYANGGFVGSAAPILQRGGNSGSQSGAVKVELVASREFDARILRVSEGVSVRVTQAGIMQNNARLPGMLAEHSAR